MDRLIAIVVLLSLIACSESWSMDVHVDTGAEHGQSVEGDSDHDLHESEGEACGHSHCHHTAVLNDTTANVRLALPALIINLHTPPIPHFSERLLRPPIA